MTTPIPKWVEEAIENEKMECARRGGGPVSSVWVDGLLEGMRAGARLVLEKLEATREKDEIELKYNQPNSYYRGRASVRKEVLE